ncbi:hypothetical protein SAMN04490244_104304 [Tranquillimonas rosea]|uniref:Sulfotransferase family protein n=1 Tax=Tranquillimonas rosea TaxID=641238 RepID=A0A1H9TP23_9RHOB|nr:hypothetical protein [Tranquillimonas rosea]SER99090.1 hypothetical protein SAMN04490244_104304 [Tranquillimonas rosea]
MERKATAVFFESPESRENPKKTVHIFGVMRGGTTSVAGVVNMLGVHLGDTVGNNLEDRRFYGPENLPLMPGHIEESNSARDVWGWKFPHSIEYLEDILPLLRNPRLILVTRDAGAVYLGMQRRNDWPPERAVFMSFNRAKRNFEFFKRHRLPTLIVSYEKLLLHPRSTVCEIADYLAVDVDEETMKHCLEWVEPESYKKTATHADLARLVGQKLDK